MHSNINNKPIPEIPILMYHEVSEIVETGKKVRHTNPAYVLSDSKFREQMEYLHQNGFRTITLDDLLDGTSFIPEKSIILTFDDGWADNYMNAFPIMKDLGQKATIFVVTNFVGQNGYMDWPQLREIRSSGFLIGSHTVSHRPLMELNELEVKNELKNSKKSIEDSLGSPVHFLSAPHGSVNRRILNMAAEIGYRGVCSSQPGLHHRGGFPNVFQRINVSGSFPLGTFVRIVKRDRSILTSIRLNKALKGGFKRLLGYKLYRSLYRLRYRIG